MMSAHVFCCFKATFLAALFASIACLTVSNMHTYK
jgi:hypothetical protein